MLFHASFNIVGHADPNPPSPLRHDVIYGRPPINEYKLKYKFYCHLTFKQTAVDKLCSSHTMRRSSVYTSNQTAPHPPLVVLTVTGT